MAQGRKFSWYRLDPFDLDVGRITTQVGGKGFRVEDPDDLEGALSAASAAEDRPSLVELVVSSRSV